MGPLAVAGISAGIAAGGSILGGLLGKSKGPPLPVEYKWQQKNGPAIWDFEKARGYDLINNPYGLGDAKNAMQRNVRSTSAAGYEMAGRQNAQDLTVAGLSSGGGESQRRSYLAGQDFATTLGRSLSDIEIADAQAKEEQRIRGENLLYNLSHTNPVYAQIAASNYWNSLNYNNDLAQGIGGAIGGTYDMYMMGKMYNQDPYSTGQGQNYWNNGVGYSGQGSPYNNNQYGNYSSNNEGPYSGPGSPYNY